MADISKIKLADGTQLDIKDATGRAAITVAQGSITAEIARATAAEATLSAAITAETTRATGAESGLSDRITNLEARGRFLSSWSCKTGKPDTYPTVPTGTTSYTYAYKSGDYYIVGNVEKDSEQKRWMPDGASISTTDGGTTWTVGKAQETREVGEGDYYTYDGSKWVLVSNSQKTVTFAKIAGDADDNANLKGKLDELRNGKLDNTATVAGVAFDTTGTTPNVPVADLQEALGLEDLAYANTASGSGSVNTIDSITMNAVTVSGNAAVTTSSANATIATKDAYTPAGTINGSAISGGSISVTLAQNDASADLSTVAYKPQGSISLTKDAAGSFQVSGTNGSSAVSFTGGSTKNVLSSVKTAAVAPSFTEGAFTPAEIQNGFYTAGSAATWTGATYTAPTLGEATTQKFVQNAILAKVSTDVEECLEFYAVADADKVAAVTAQGTFNGGNVNFGTFNGGSATVIDTTKFSGGSKAADTFDAGSAAEFNTADVIDDIGTGTAAAQTFTGDKFAPAFDGKQEANMVVTGVTYKAAAINTATFTSTAASLTFAGTEVKNLIPSVITYDKADATAAYSSTVTPTVATYTRTAKTVSVTVTPDAE